MTTEYFSSMPTIQINTRSVSEILSGAAYIN